MAITCTHKEARRWQRARSHQVPRNSVKGKEDEDCCGLTGGYKGDILKDGLGALTSVGRGGVHRQEAQAGLDQPTLSELLVGI